MKSIKEIRRANLQQCIADAGSQKVFLEKYGHLYGDDGNLSPSYLNQLLSGTTAIGNGAAAKLSKALGKPVNWFDVDRGESLDLPKTTPRDWPFSVSRDLFLGMDAEEQQRIDRFVTFSVNDWHTQHHRKSKKTG